MKQADIQRVLHLVNVPQMLAVVLPEPLLWLAFQMESGTQEGCLISPLRRRLGWEAKHIFFPEMAQLTVQGAA